MNVAGYMKYAKLWERNHDAAISLQRKYYTKLCAGNPDYHLVDVYVDITGAKKIRSRPEMLRLLSDCVDGRIDLIYAQTHGYLAANTGELCYLIKFLFELDHRIDIITEDAAYNINTIRNVDDQRKELYNWADKFSRLKPSDYTAWKDQILKIITKR